MKKELNIEEVAKQIFDDPVPVLFIDTCAALDVIRAPARKDIQTNVISAAIRNVDSCSNDPLCSEQIPTSSRVSGAACYACLLISETSCEYSNAYLDRNLLSESIS